MISEDRGRGVEADWTLRQALQRPTLSLTAHDDDHLAAPRDRRQPQRYRLLGERTGAGRHVRSVGGHIVDALLEQPYGPGDRIECGPRLVRGQVSVGPEAEHHEIEATQPSDRLLVLAAHHVQIWGIHAESMAVLRLHLRPRQELAAYLAPEVAVGGRRRAQLVHAQHTHSGELDRRVRLQIAQPLVHPPRRTAGTD